MHPQSVPVHVFHEDLFRGLKGSAGEDFAAIETRAFYTAGVSLFEADEPAFGLFVVHRGSVAVSNSNWEEGLAGCSTFLAGEVLGLSAAVSGEAYQASARTLELSEIGMVSRADFLEFLATHGEFAFRVVGLLSDSLNSACDHLRALPPAIQA